MEFKGVEWSSLWLNGVHGGCMEFTVVEWSSRGLNVVHGG